GRRADTVTGIAQAVGGIARTLTVVVGRRDEHIAAQRAVVGLRTRIQSDRRPRPPIIVAVAARITVRERRRERTVGIDVNFGAQITADLDAGIGAGDIVEAGAVERADLHVLSRHARLVAEQSDDATTL